MGPWQPGGDGSCRGAAEEQQQPPSPSLLLVVCAHRWLKMEAHLREQLLAGISSPSSGGHAGGGHAGGGLVGGGLVGGGPAGGGLAVHVEQEVFQALGAVAPLARQAQDVVVVALRVVLQEEETHQELR